MADSRVGVLSECGAGALDLARENPWLVGGGAASLLGLGLLRLDRWLDGRLVDRGERAVRRLDTPVDPRAEIARTGLPGPQVRVSHSPDQFRPAPWHAVGREDLPRTGGAMFPYVEYDPDRGRWRATEVLVHVPYADGRKRVWRSDLLHELGHARSVTEDPDRFVGEGRPGAMAWLGQSLAGVIDPDRAPGMREEMRAWDYAGYRRGDPLREAALDTYRGYARRLPLRVLGTALTGAGLLAAGFGAVRRVSGGGGHGQVS